MEEFRRLTRLPAYVFNITSDLKAAARKRGEDVIDFGMGNPDGATPKHIVDKLIEAAQKTATHRYSLSRGIPRLRRAICNWYKTRYDVDLNQETEAIVTIGSKEGIAHLCLAVLDDEDTVAVPNPSYPIHIFGPVIAGSKVHSIAIDGMDEASLLAQLEHDLRKAEPRPKLLILNFPANPTTQCVELSFFVKPGGAVQANWESISCMTWSCMRTWCLTDIVRRAFWRFRGRRRSRWSSLRSRRATTCRDGGLGLWWGTPEAWWRRWDGSRAYFDYGTFYSDSGGFDRGAGRGRRIVWLRLSRTISAGGMCFRCRG